MTFKRHNLERENTFFFGDYDLSNLVVVEKVVRSFVPPLLSNATKISGKDGRHYRPSDRDSIDVVVRLRFIEKTYEKIQERALEVARILDSKEPQKLLLRDCKYHNLAIATQTTDLEKRVNSGVCEVVFTCYDNSYYGDLIQVSLGEDVTFTNRGRETSGVMVLTTDDTDLIRVIHNDGTFLRLDNSFTAGTNLVIHLNKQWIRANNNLIMDKLTFDSDFFSIDPGQNNIKIIGAQGYLEYTERW